MKNPYEKPLNAPDQKDTYFRFYLSDPSTKWHWFEVSGALWWSKEKIKFQYSYATYYCLEVFERYIRRYKYISEKKCIDFINKVEARWQWGSQAHVRIPHYLQSQYGLWSNGDFYQIIFEESECEKCGSKTHYRAGNWQLGEGVKLYYDYKAERTYHYGQFSTQPFCKWCYEAEKFMRGQHHLIKAAKELKVTARRPLTAYRNAEPEDKVVIASAGLLDFEARYMQKRESIESSAMKDKHQHKAMVRH